MNRKEYRDFVRDGGKSFTLYFAVPHSTYAERVSDAEGRNYQEVFRRALGEYRQKHHPNLYGERKEVSDV